MIFIDGESNSTSMKINKNTFQYQSNGKFNIILLAPLTFPNMNTHPPTLLIVYFSQMMTLTPDSPIFPEWETPSIPMTSKFYFFDVMNPDEVFNGAKPVLVEKGPYIYK